MMWLRRWYRFVILLGERLFWQQVINQECVRGLSFWRVCVSVEVWLSRVSTGKVVKNSLKLSRLGINGHFCCPSEAEVAALSGCFGADRVLLSIHAWTVSR